MKQLIIVFFFCIGTLDALCQAQNMGELPTEIDTVINGIETKFIFLDVVIHSRDGSYAKMEIGFRNPVTKEWLWFDAPNVPFDVEKGFTHAFPLKIKKGFENKDMQFIYSIIETKGGTYTWRCSCTKYKQNGPI